MNPNMKVAPVINIVSVAGEIKLQAAVNVPADTIQPFRFTIKKGQKNSRFYNKPEHGSDAGVKAILTAAAPTGGPSPGPILARADRIGAGQPVLGHSDGGESGTVNIDPEPADYFGSFYWDDGLPHKLVIAYGNGGQ